MYYSNLLAAHKFQYIFVFFLQFLFLDPFPPTVRDATDTRQINWHAFLAEFKVRNLYVAFRLTPNYSPYFYKLLSFILKKIKMKPIIRRQKNWKKHNISHLSKKAGHMNQVCQEWWGVLLAIISMWLCVIPGHEWRSQSLSDHWRIIRYMHCTALLIPESAFKSDIFRKRSLHFAFSE